MNPLGPILRSCCKRRFHLLAIDRVEDLVDAPPPAGIDVRVVTEADAERVRDFRDEKVVGLFRGTLVWADPSVYAWMDGRVVGHFSSLSVGVAHRAPGTVPMQAGDALLTWGNVREDLRGRGIFQAMIRRLTRELFADPDVKRVVSDVNVGDAASLAAHRKCGFRVLGELRYLRVLNVVLRRSFVPAP